MNLNENTLGNTGAVEFDMEQRVIEAKESIWRTILNYLVFSK